MTSSLPSILQERYEIRQQLGQQPGRKTFLACDLQTQDLVVVKLLKFDRETIWEYVELFEREAKTLQNLSHSAIPRYLDYFELNLPDYQGFGLVQTYLNAESLDYHLKSGRNFSESEVKEIARSLLEILIYLHERQPPVIHRDIKPSNILLTHRSGHTVGRVYLVDFGSVQNLVAREGGTFTVVGTYGYMPPEQFGGRTVPASDLYALGATLIHLITGRLPADLPQKNLQIQFEPVANLSAEFSTWLKHLIEPSLEKRFQSARQALEILEKPELLGAIALPNQKPNDSKILLSQNEQFIKIVIPPKSFPKRLAIKTRSLQSFSIALVNFILICLTIGSLVSLLLLASIIPVLILQQLISSIAIGNDFLKTLLFNVIKIGIPCLIIVNVLYAIVDRFFKEKELGITQDKIYLTEKRFGRKINYASSPKHHINKLEITQSYIEDDGEGRRKQINPELIIWAGTQEYKLTDLTLTEVEWLGRELSDWLRLPLQDRKVPIIKS